MEKEYFNIKDSCRKGLLKYLSKAISIIPIIEKPLILDVGCGSGVPTIALAESLNGIVTAVDVDTKPLIRLEEKAKELNLSNRITIVNSSLFDIKFEENQFDIILLEGFLNVTGFEKGFSEVIKLLKRNRYIIVHDDFRNHSKKTKFIENNNCKVLKSLWLDEQVWWNDYYKCLEKEAKAIKNKKLLELFETDLREIKLFKQDSSQFKSIYYVIVKN